MIFYLNYEFAGKKHYVAIRARDIAEAQHGFDLYVLGLYAAEARFGVKLHEVSQFKRRGVSYLELF